MLPIRALALVLACALPALAAAQWQWIDKDGRKVFSDKAPPPEIPERSILRRPGMRAAVAPEPQAPASAATATAKAAPANVPRISGRDAALEEKKKQAEAAQAEKKKQQEAEVAAAKADNCKRARQSKATFDSGIRLSRVNEKGEREVLDDRARAAEMKHIQAIIDRDCV